MASIDLTSLTQLAQNTAGQVQQAIGQAQGLIDTVQGFKLDQLIQRVQLDSAYGPQIVVEKPLVAKPGAPGPGPMELVLKRLQPKVTVTFSSGLSPIVLKPYGDPPPTRWPIVRNVGIAAGATVGGLALFGLYKLLAGVFGGR